MTAPRDNKEKDRQNLLILEERKRLARDLHDSVNQKLFSVSLIARGIHHKLDGDHDESIKKGIHDIEALARDALTDLRNLIWQLRPIDPEQDFLALLREYGEQIGLQVNVECRGKEVDVDVEVIEAVMRIGQEALNNVKKHAMVDQAYILFDIDYHCLQLHIKDHGCSFTVDDTGLNPGSSGLGLRNMKERAEQLGGKINVISTPGQGTTLSLFVPLPGGASLDGC